MKKVATILAVIFAVAFTANTFAQATDNEVITITANLNTSLYLDMGSAGYMPIEFNFNTLEDYNNGLGGHDNFDYYHMAAISSTANWKFGVKAISSFEHSDNSTTMPLNNLGISIGWEGSNTVQNNVDGTPAALSTDEVILIEQSGDISNAGDYSDNQFNIFYEMGTQNGNMNSQSIFEQDLKKGTYTVDVEFVATEVL